VYDLYGSYNLRLLLVTIVIFLTLALLSFVVYITFKNILAICNW